MLLQCALIPPRGAVEELSAFLEAVRRPGEVEPPAKHRFGRRKGPESEPEAVPPELDRLPLEELALPVTGFGNVTTSDAHRIVEAIAQGAREWAAPTIHFAGGTALDFPGDRSVWVRIDGDVDETLTIARGVPQSVEHLGFFVDRRVFRPMLAVATVNGSTTAPDLNVVVDALNEFRGQDWRIDAVVLQADSFAGTRAVWREFERVPLG